MPDISEIVDVNVVVEEAALTPAAFGRPAIFGTAAAISPDDFRLYTALSGMTDDGFATTDAEYVMAAALMAQSAISGRRVTDWIVARRLTPVAQIQTLAVVYDVASTYNVVIGGASFGDVTVNVAATVDADTTEAAIATAINASLAAPYVTASSAGPDITITSDRAGVPISVTVSVTAGAGTLSNATTTANVGLPEDLARVVAAGAEFYCTLTTDRDAGDIEALSAAVEVATPPKIFIPMSVDDQVDDAAYSSSSVPGHLGVNLDIASELKGNNRNRTALFFHETASESADGAWAGRCLPFTPGTITWALKELSGVTANSLTDTEYARVTGTKTDPTSGKNANTLVPHGSQVSVTQRGMMASGRFIDVQIVADYLQNQVQTSVANLLLSTPKLPYDTSGIQRVAMAVRAPLQAAKEAGILASDRDILVSVPDSALVSSSDRTNRVLNNVTASVVYSGGIHYVQINLTVSL